MTIDFTPYFLRYEALVTMADAAFERVKAEFGECVSCRQGCADCCHALFDLTLIEAIYINNHFYRVHDGEMRQKLLAKADQADRQVYLIKKRAYRNYREGTDENEILAHLATERLRCPLLNDQNRCDLYEYRPITCRLYGIPTSIGGKAHTCGLSGFKEGTSYPTANLDAIHQRLYDISADLVASLQTSYRKMGDMLVPLSMALLTVYDDAYLGVGAADIDPDKGEN